MCIFFLLKILGIQMNTHKYITGPPLTTTSHEDEGRSPPSPLAKLGGHAGANGYLALGSAKNCS